MNSIKRNFAYSSALTVSGFIFPLITYPYVSRVLGVNNIGICNFVDSVINYIILFSMLGIGTIGIREIARYKNNQEELEKSFRDLIAFNFLSTVLVLVIFIVLIFSVPKFYEYKELMFIGVLKLIFNFFLVEWFYKGIENFRYITVRSLAVKILYVIAVFVFVRKQDDYVLYYLISVLMIVANAISNWSYLSKIIKIRFKEVNFKRYITPLFILGLYALLTSMYTSFNITYLGFVSGETEVGYYTTATKLYSILLGLFTAFTGVMLPRMSSLVAEGRLDEFKRLTGKSYDILLGFSLPIVLLAVVFAPQIIYILSGSGYEGAIMPMRVVMPLMLIIGYEQIIIVQILMPLKKDKAILINSILGAGVGVLMNILLVSSMKSIGSALVWVSSELVVLISAQLFVTKYTKYNFPFRKFALHFLLSVPPLLICLYLYYYYAEISAFLILLLAGIIVFLYYFVIQIKVLKNDLVIGLLYKLMYAFRAKK